MRCECCDAELSDSEATAKFLETDGSKPSRYVGMCSKCRGFLPPNVRYVVRHDLKSTDKKNEAELYDPFDLGDMDDESW